MVGPAKSANQWLSFARSPDGQEISTFLRFPSPARSRKTLGSMYYQEVEEDE